MFSKASVIPSTGEGRTPLGQTPPLADTPLGRHLPGQTPPPGETPPRQTPPQADPSPKMATAADGTHPTGMYSCCYC